MFDNDDEPKKRASFILGQNLDDLSVEELEETIMILNKEIERLQTAKEVKAKHLSAAAALFSKK